MRRTRGWWARLEEHERAYIVYFERNQGKGSGYGGYLPDDCSECSICGGAMLGSGECMPCVDRYLEAIKKADTLETIHVGDDDKTDLAVIGDNKGGVEEEEGLPF